jgi:hypothetical protein
MRAKVFVFFLALFAATTSGHVYTIDGVLNYLVTKSMASRGSIAVPGFMMTVEGKDGRHYSKLGIGQSLASLPLYWMGSAVEKASPGNPLFRVYSQHFTVPHEPAPVHAEPQTLVRMSDTEGAPLFFVTLTNAFIAAALCLIFYLVLTRFGASARTAFAGALTLGFGTPVWVYSRDLFGDPLFAVCALAAFYIIAPYPGGASWGRLAVAGLVSSLGILTRASFIPIAAAFAVYLLVVSRRRGESARGMLAYVTALIPGIGIYALLNYVRFGSVWLSGYHTAFDKGFSVPVLDGLAWNLFSPYRSIFLYAPPVVAGLIGLGAFGRKRWGTLVLLIAVVAYTFVVYSGWWAWHGGWCWGPRFLVPAIPLLLIPGFAGAGPWSMPRRVLAIVLAAAGFAVQVGAILINYTAGYDYWIKIGLLDWAEQGIQTFSPIMVHWKAVLATNPADYDLWLVQAARVNLPAAVVTAAVLGTVAFAVGRAVWRHEA